MTDLKLKKVKKKAKPNKKILLQADRLNKSIIQLSKEVQGDVKHLPDEHAIRRIYLASFRLVKLQESLDILKNYFLLSLP